MVTVKYGVRETLVGPMVGKERGWDTKYTIEKELECGVYCIGRVGRREGRHTHMHRERQRHRKRDREREKVGEREEGREEEQREERGKERREKELEERDWRWAELLFKGPLHLLTVPLQRGDCAEGAGPKCA